MTALFRVVVRRRVGSVGMADILVLDANPLENIRNSNGIRYVMKNGRIYDGNTLNEIWPRQRTLASQYWQGGVPQTAAGIR